jgi:hypothetical protein
MTEHKTPRAAEAQSRQSNAKGIPIHVPLLANELRAQPSGALAPTPIAKLPQL